MCLQKCSQTFKTLAAARNSWQYLSTFVFPQPHCVVFVWVQLFLLCAHVRVSCLCVCLRHIHTTTPMRILRRFLKWQKVSLRVEISGPSELWEGRALTATLLDCHFSLTFGWVSQLSLYCSHLEPPPSEIILLLRQAVKGTQTPLWQINLGEHVLVVNLCPSPATCR